MADKQAQLDAIAEDIQKDGVTPELVASATQLVLGDGNPDADVVFIGEAPGKNEDLQGKPFVGASGKFLNEMLEMIGMQRSDVYITNIVKYRPPDNRDPKPEEKKAFLPYLQRQLEVIQPKVVVTLGRHSMNCFLPDLQISKVHGQPKRVTLSLKKNSTDTLEVVILPLFHPAAALYNPQQRQVLIDDFAAIPIILEKLDK
ncbi:MAG: Phage polymerase-related protein [Candidatus Saccharibacteria bacterium]|nr:Phage polymerase-related protein [Candidatus Saccharibacteria bacterium]